jgi:hypothetical protein
MNLKPSIWTTHVITKRILDAARCVFVANVGVLTRLYIEALWKRIYVHPPLFFLNAFRKNIGSL